MTHTRIYFLLSLIICGTLFLPSCIFNQDATEQKKTGLVVINVLKKELYDDCHIAGSLSVPFEHVVPYVQAHVDKNAEIIVYCSNYLCSASGATCKQLQRVGFKNVYAYEAGTAEWYQKGLPVVGPCKASYLQTTLERSVEDDADVRIITTQELAHKMNVEKKIE